MGETGRDEKSAPLILIVDDERDIAEMLRDFGIVAVLAKRPGHLVTLALVGTALLIATGAVAYRALREHSTRA